MGTRTRRSTVRRRASRLLSETLLTSLVRSSQQARRTQFEALGVPRQHVVMLGDSITEFGMWAEWFPDSPIVNRGIGGETSGQVLTRLHSAIDEPRAVFLLVGTNDLAFDIRHEEIAHNVEAIAGAIERAAPGTPVVVQSVMPRALAFRDEIIELNRRFQALVETGPDHVKYLDLWPSLATAEGALRPELTEDSLHLNGDGYACWVEELQLTFTELGVTDSELD